MAYNIIILLLIVGNIVGWGLLAYHIHHTLYSRRCELRLIQDIRHEVERIKEDLTDAKINR